MKVQVSLAGDAIELSLLDEDQLGVYEKPLVDDVLEAVERALADSDDVHAVGDLCEDHVAGSEFWIHVDDMAEHRFEIAAEALRLIHEAEHDQWAVQFCSRCRPVLDRVVAA